ncbi:hypothetical protein P280DRAFT_482447 [Massarina eburnea CBS 473.64]|uniref:Uncharacterized protein n=1 Tax=Massarina eburnea CBS 473.64 TaxID=1395130 RepID=A0A6A6RSJ2_9PLEO|nr:hypothetical protein P280DRAFT_482447 [Massarina eburnea CBS 473.64]
MVPCLCATATLVGASAAGLSFGRECPPDAPSKKGKAAPAREAERKPMLAQVQTATTTTTTNTANTANTAYTCPSLNIRKPHPSSRTPFVDPFAANPAQDGRTQRRIARGTTSADLPSAQTNGGAANGTEDREPAASRRTSWIKRLSAISTSQPSSRDTSPGPLSTSFSVSNRSMAFSHDGSTAPMIGDRPPPPMPPNKLVKRSSSVQAREAASHGTGSRLPSFRRPATSHQRSATLQHQTALLERTVEDPSEHPSEHVYLHPHRTSDSEVEYTHYFTAKVTSDKPKRKGSLGSAKALKRIDPDSTRKPTLLLAGSVSARTSASADESEESTDGGGSVYFMSRPGTPMSLAAVITQSEAPQPSDSTDNATRSRHSFSITDFLSPNLNAKKQRGIKLPGANLVRRLSQKRATSAPLPETMAKKCQSGTAQGEPAAAAARRGLSDPTLVRRQITTSAGLPPSGNARHGTFAGGSSSSPLPALPPPALGMADRSPTSMRTDQVQPTASANTNQNPPSPTLHTAGRPSRHSMAHSEQASTLVGSDNEARGVGTGDEDDADLQSETVFDSLRTGATRSTSGARGPRIETIFDESPPSKVKITALRDLLPKGTFREQTADAAPGHQSIAEEDESISTPVRTIVPDRSVHGSPSFARGLSAPLFPNLIPSSPPDMPKSLSLGTLEWDSRAGDDDSSSRWSIDEEDGDDSWGDLSTQASIVRVATPVLLGRHNLRLLASGPSPNPSTPPAHHLNLDHGDRDARSSIFDWSEQQHTDKSSGNRTPPRPSTVHGKKDADRRGSRSVGRRVPSGLHARSQSVPVVPDATSKRNTVVTNKFGTWGVGSKGVTEDWNDDFDFSDLDEDSNAEGAAESQRVDSGAAMFVPKTIQEQQSNVLANIGLLREWGLLIEELKEQRVRAASLGILQGPYAGTWEEVDAMIDLADQEAEHEGIARLSPPSSPAFDEDVFADVPGPSPNHKHEIRKSDSAGEDIGRNRTAMLPGCQPKRARKSILRSHHQIFGPHSSPIPAKSKYVSPPTPSTKPATRPRKDSEAKARSVIEALQKRKSTPDPLADTVQAVGSPKKVPFDTATLRRIVPYVSSLTRTVKDTLREAEGLYYSPSTSPSKENQPPIRKMFQTDNDLSTQMKLMTVM